FPPSQWTPAFPATNNPFPTKQGSYSIQPFQLLLNLSSVVKQHFVDALKSMSASTFIPERFILAIPPSAVASHGSSNCFYDGNGYRACKTNREEIRFVRPSQRQTNTRNC